MFHYLRSSLPLLCLLLVAGCARTGTASSPKPTVRSRPIIALHDVTPTPILGPAVTSGTSVVETPTSALPAYPTSTPVFPASPTATAVLPPRPTSTPPPTEPPASSAGPGVLVSASLRPEMVVPGGSVDATVVTSGSVARVDMYLGSIGPTAPAPLTYSLVETAPGTWTGTGAAPSVPGQFHYTVGLYAGGKRMIQDNNAWNIQVAGPPTSPPAAQAQPIPADIPLTPPFSYGNPMPAVFSAGGRSVNGSEVVSDSQPNVPASVVAQFYTNRLPRAGWTVTSSSGGGAGASSFSMAATSAGAAGLRACVVDYSAGTVQIFYGTVTG